MVGLLDMAPVAEKVSVRGREFAVNGLALEDIRDLLAAFPDAASLAQDGLNAGRLLAAAPDLVAAGICLALGYKGSSEEVASVKRWPAGDQIKILNAVIGLTAPDGIGPFVEIAGTLLKGVESIGDPTTKAQGTTSRRPSRAAPVMATKPPK